MPSSQLSDSMEDPSTHLGSETSEDKDLNMAEAVTQDPEIVRIIFSTLDSFLQYARVSFMTVTHSRRQAFYALPEADWKMLAAPPVNYLETLDKVDEGIRSNAELGRAIVRSARYAKGFWTAEGFYAEGPVDDEDFALPPDWPGYSTPGDVDKAKSTIRQFYRDWTAEGAAEREACYGPVKRVLAKERRRLGLPEDTELTESSERFTVLIPGCGLARLNTDLVLEGYSVEGNEISFHQIFGSNHILNHCTEAGQHTIYPWIHSFSNHKTRSNHLRGCKVPDIAVDQEIRKAGARAGSMVTIAEDFLTHYGKDNPCAHDRFDAVVTVFFLDTAPNLLRYLETIYNVLKPGAILVNIGPLLWHFENQYWPPDESDGGDGRNTSGIADPGSFELADDEVRALVETFGFVIESWETGIEAPYMQDPDSMLTNVYRASSWVARKPEASKDKRKGSD